ncbi:hypothetical protein HYU09_05215 [Candidatus Woesearchaeota archaeon]|nr:hypothetical protein [Candidatus Woesearchaeota archaeon]
MKNDFSKYMCEICKFSFGFDNMAYSSDGKKLICKNCYNIIAKRNDKPTLEESRIKSSVALQLPLSVPDRVNMMCVDCKYKFSLKTGSRIAAVCPYCSKGRLAKYDELTADNLINEVSNSKNFY